MNFTADTKEFLAALALAGRVIPAKSPWPILTNVKIVTNDDRVTLIGSDGDMNFEASLAANVETEGVCALPFAPLATFCKAAKADTIKIAIADKARISASRSRIDLIPAHVEDYPAYLPADGDPVGLDKDALVAALRFAASAVEDSEVRYHLAGVNFSETDGSVHLYGTDGNAMHRAVLSGIAEIGGGGTLPLASVLVVLAMAEKAKEVSFMISDRGWHFVAENARAWGKVVDGSFPNVGRIYSQFIDWQDVCIGDRDDFTAALSVATCGADTGSDKARSLIVRADTGKPIIVRGHRAIGGVLHAGRAEMTAEATGDFAGAINSRHLTNAINGIKGDSIVLAASGRPSDGGAVITLKPAQEDATLEMSALIMAMRTSEAELADV